MIWKIISFDHCKFTFDLQIAGPPNSKWQSWEDSVVWPMAFAAVPSWGLHAIGNVYGIIATIASLTWTALSLKQQTCWVLAMLLQSAHIFDSSCCIFMVSTSSQIQYV